MSQRRIEYDWGVAYLNEHGQYHREDGPAVTRFSKAGSVEEWWLNGKVHRINGPAETMFLGKGKIVEAWSINDRFIRVY